MKKFIWVLVSLLLAALLIGCQVTPDNGETPDDGPAGPTEPGEDTGTFWLTGEGESRYKIVRPDICSSEVRTMGTGVRDALKAMLAVNVSLENDWVERGTPAGELSAPWEILIGKTNRPESAQALESLGKNEWVIRVIGHKVVVTGGTDRATGFAVAYFIENYLKDAETMKSDVLYVGSFRPDPRDEKLPDHSSGTANPRLVVTRYATEDVVVADIIPTEDGYAVDPTGETDSTEGIQKALNDCRSNGGGTVYLPAGVYVISGTVTIPEFVTLRGDWQDPDEGTEYGTIIHVWQDPEDSNDKGLFLLGGSGGAIGLTVYYENQSVGNVQKYPFVFYTNGQGNNYMLSTVKNCTVINGYRGIGACCVGSAAHEQLTVENVKGTFLCCGAEVYNQADVGTWQNVVIDNRYWKQAAATIMTAADGAALDAYTRANTVGLILGDLEWTEFESLRVTGCKTGIEIVKGKRIEFAGSLYDVEIKDCGQGLVVDADALDGRWGMVIAHSTIEGGIDNRSTAGGAVKLCGVSVTGSKSGKIIEDATSDLSAYSVDYLASYRKPVAELYVARLDRTGAADVSAALQQMLNTAGETGGVVYLPGGLYRMDQPVNVPAGVELRGASSVATRDQGGSYLGTVILAYYGDDATSSTSDRALITLAGEGAGLNGIRVYYPENGPYDSDLTTTYTVRGTANNVYVVNCEIAASGYGIDFSGCDNHFIKKVTSCCYYNTFLLGGQGGILCGCLQNGTAICRCAIPGRVAPLNEGNIFTDLFDPILRLTSKYIILRGAKDETIFNTFCYGCATLVTCEQSTDVLVVNVGSDNIGKSTAQTVMKSGSMTVINAMRYNGHSYDHTGGSLKLFNRLTINSKNEMTEIH